MTQPRNISFDVEKWGQWRHYDAEMAPCRCRDRSCKCRRGGRQFSTFDLIQVVWHYNKGRIKFTCKHCSARWQFDDVGWIGGPRLDASHPQVKDMINMNMRRGAA